MQLIFILIRRSFAWVETLSVIQPEASEKSFKLKPGDCCCSAAEIKKLKSMPIKRTRTLPSTCHLFKWIVHKPVTAGECYTKSTDNLHQHEFKRRLHQINLINKHLIPPSPSCHTEPKHMSTNNIFQGDLTFNRKGFRSVSKCS